MKVTIIDNYDSFTYNLAHLVRELGAEVTVYRNDKFEMPQLMSADKIILSPGPGIPQEAGLLLDVIKQYAALKPMLGVCLGHQAIGSVFGAQLTNLSEVFHGIQSTIEICPEEPLFKGLPREIEVGRYHSWVVDNKNLPQCLKVTATSKEGQIMALRHTAYNLCGIQFHPESILTPHGKTIVANWLASK